MFRLFILFGIIVITATSVAQAPYQFTTVIDLETTPVISQGNTGTCWSFSSTSFLESEVIRLTGKQVDLSEMYTVRNTYPKKADNYVMRQGKAQFSEGGLAHDVMNSVAEYGLVFLLAIHLFGGLRLMAFESLEWSNNQKSAAAWAVGAAFAISTVFFLRAI